MNILVLENDRGVFEYLYNLDEKNLEPKADIAE